MSHSHAYVTADGGDACACGATADLVCVECAQATCQHCQQSIHGGASAHVPTLGNMHELSNKGLLTAAEIGRLRALVKIHGERGTAEKIGVSRPTIARAMAGLTLSGPTAFMITERLRQWD